MSFFGPLLFSIINICITFTIKFKKEGYTREKRNGKKNHSNFSTSSFVMPWQDEAGLAA